MLLTRKIKIKPSKIDAKKLEDQSNLCRYLYNNALEERIRAYKYSKISLNVWQQKKELPLLKKELPEFKQVYNKYLSATLFRLDKAFKSFFKRGNKGFPRYRGKHYFFTLDCPAMYVKRISNKKLQLPQKIKVKLTESMPDSFHDLHIFKQKNNWYITFAYDESEKYFIDNGKINAIDLGLKKLVTGINQEGLITEIIHRKPTFKELKRLDKLRSKRDKCKKGSRQWKYLTGRLKEENTEWRNKILDHLHKVSYTLTNRTERTLVIGDLKPSKMKSKIKKLNRLVQNEWRISTFIKMLEYKAKRFGVNLVKVNEAYTTQDCCNCGLRKKKKLSQRIHDCSCGLKIDRDINSAINILKRYLLGQSHLTINVSTLVGNLNNAHN